MRRHGVRRLFLGGLLTLLIAQMLYGALMLSALYKQYQDPILQINGMLCKDLSDRLGFQVRVGKALRASTVERFDEPLRDRTEINAFAVAAPDGRILYQWNDSGQERLIIPRNTRQVFGPVRTFSSATKIWLTSPVVDKAGSAVGHVFVAVGKDAVFSRVFESSQHLFLLFFGITISECLLLALLLFWGTKRGSVTPDCQEQKNSIFLRTCIILPLVLGQLSFLLLLVSPLTKLYTAENLEASHQAASQIKWDLERLVSMGMNVSEIRSMDTWLISRQRFVDSLGIAIYDENGNLHCAADKNGVLPLDRWKELRQTISITSEYILDENTGDAAGTVCVALEPDAAMRDLRSVMLDNLTLTVVAALFLAEITYLLLMSGGGVARMVAKPEFMRPVIFSCLLGTEMAMSYVPIRIGELGLDLFDLPPDVISGLPISCELFMAGAAMLIGGFWSQRSGWRPMLILGIALASIGSLASWLSFGPLPFILSRGLSGLGYGFINLSAQVFVIAHSSANQRARMLAFMFAGLYAGSLSGSALGGLIADRLGYVAVFPASGLLLLALAVLLWRCLPREPWIAEKNEDSFSLREAAHFIADRRMGSLLMFFIIPSALITVCLFQFFVPLSLSQIGTSPASIGRVFLVYCVIVMFAGPAFGGIIDRSKKMQNPLLLSILLAAASILCLVWLDGITGAVCSVAVLAVSTAIASNGQAAYALSLPAAQRFGRSRTMGLYNVAMRIGQVLGPLSLGIMMSLWDARFGLTVLAIFTAVCAVLFYALSWSGKETKEAGR